MRFLIAGSSGFLGTQLRTALDEAGHDVIRLVRGEPGGPDQRRWDPYVGALGVEVVEDVDVVVNLAGAPLFGNPHSKKWRHAVEDSRVTTTRVLAEAIAASPSRPVFLAGNGISIYGDRGDEVLDESSAPHGSHLLTHVSKVWQEATKPAEEAGARVVHLRTSPVLDRRSPPLSLLAPIFRLGLGGPLGSGDQYFPTLTAADWVRAVIHCAEYDSLRGPVNLTIPTPATNAEFTKAMGSALGRPTLLRVPGFVIKPVAGDLSPELLGSVRAVPKALLDAGFEFTSADIDATVRAGLSAGR